jgi:hypothetical protein
MTGADRAQAPAAPGRLGQAIPADQLLAYLDALTDWRAARKQELDRIDTAAQRAQDADAYTSDLMLAMTIWQSVTDRLDRLTEVWDSGRVGPQQREEMSRLIWGTGVGAGTANPGLALSLVEACRLSDALTAALRARLSFDPVAADVAARIAATRASLQRSQEMLADPRAARPAQVPDVDGLRRRLSELAAKARQGGDVTGPFAVLEATTARAERDLIVSAAQHHDLGRDHRAALQRRRELVAEQEELQALVTRAVAEVTPTPRMAVPDVTRLGRVPQTRAELDAYRRRLERVAAALAFAEAGYSAPLDERDELRGRLDAFAAKAAAIGRAGDPAVTAAYDRARGLLWSVPCPVPEARELVAEYQRLLSTTPGEGTT